MYYFSIGLSTYYYVWRAVRLQQSISIIKEFVAQLLEQTFWGPLLKLEIHKCIEWQIAPVIAHFNAVG